MSLALRRIDIMILQLKVAIDAAEQAVRIRVDSIVIKETVLLSLPGFLGRVAHP
jgi:hypothetical protein